DGRRIRARPRGQGHGARRERFVEHRTRSDLFPVVVLGIDPEDGRSGDAVIARYLVGELDRGQGLEQREQRTAEEPGLLTSDNRDGARIGEGSARFTRARRRLTLRLLGRNDRGDLVPPAGVSLRARDSVGQWRAIGRILRKKW